jgi:hypothetical protein
MEKRQRLTYDQVLEYERTLPQEIQEETGSKNPEAARFVIRHFLGEEWINKHIMPPAIGYLALQDIDGVFELQCVRVMEFGESLLNLQGLSGFDEYIERIKTVRSPEPFLAELHIAKMLFINDWAVRFVVPTGKEGEDYDLEWPMQGLTTCADAKCKIDGTVINGKSITRTLQKCRSQLPPDHPGIFFVKIPQQWLEVEDHATITGEAAMDFFKKGTQRVVSIVYYSEPLSWKDGTIRQDHRFKEVTNPNTTRFGRDLDWRVFQKWWPSSPLSSNAMPPKWMRLLRPGSPNER